LLQRKKEKPGKRLGKTTGWIHRLSLKHKQVEMLGGVDYVRIDDQGLHLIGGAFKALELDARHAIDQACRLAALI
jgi:2,4-dienoyl-CoA reductase (NADPH2)